MTKMDATTREQLLRAALAKRLQQAASARMAEAKDNGIPIADRDRALDLSFSQQRLWFLSQMEGFSEAYHMPQALRLHGELDRAALRKALDRLVFRHESLRTTFARVDDAPVQRIAPAGIGCALGECDLNAHEDATAALDSIIREETGRPFDLEQGPLFRSLLVRMGEREHMLLLTAHHIISDGWSQGIILDELTTLYRSYHEGQDDPLSPLPLQYADYAQWQRQWLSGQVLEKQSEYWRRTLTGAPTLLELPTDRPRPAQQTFDGDRVELTFDAALTSQLKALGRRHGMTLYMTVLAAWAIVLSRLSGQEDLVIGTPVANRTRPELESLIGFFVNTQALRVNVEGSVADVLKRVKTQVFDAQEHQELPFEHVVDLIKPPRSLGHTPIFQAMLAWQSESEGGKTFGNLSLSYADHGYDTAKFDLTLNLGEKGDRISGGLDYATALFDRSTIERHAEYLRHVLIAMVADDQQATNRIDLLNDDERRALLSLGDGGPALDAGCADLFALVARQAERTPDTVAAVEPGAELTYRQLTRRANGLAEQLRQLGAGPESRVALLADRSIESIVGVLGILAAGAAYVPLDPSYPDDRLTFVLDDAQALAVVAPAALAARAAAAAKLRPELSAKTLLVAQAPERETPPATDIRGDNAAYVIYTSGSTGVPKGVVVEHRSAMNLVQGFIARHAFAEQRLLMIPPLIFDASVGDVFPALAVGATLVLHPAPAELGATELSRFCREHRVTAIDAPAAMWRQWTDGLIELSATDTTEILPDLRLMMFGGEAVTLEQVRRFAKLTGNRVALSNHYGPTEASVCATMLTTRDGAELGGTELSIGHPLPGVQVYVLDAQLKLVPRGVEGELCIGGVQVARGYLNRPELNAEQFVRNPFADTADTDARLYRTGDLVRWSADGTLQFAGRRDHQVKIRGFRIELSEIEVCLSQHPDIRDVAVLAREDAPGDKRLVAYVTGTGELRPETLRAHLASLLPEHMVPAAYVRLDSIPLTPNGKLDRKALPAPDATAFVARSYEAPAGEAEVIIAQAWAQVLKLDRVGRHDNFFDLGGHSLAAITLVAALQKHVDAQISDIFRWPTVVEQAQHLRPSGDALQRRIARAKASLSTGAERYRQMTEDANYRARVDAYRSEVDRDLGRFVTKRLDASCVLLTGATGYLGAYLLHELISTRQCRIVAPVRGTDQKDAERRLHDTLDHYFGASFRTLCEGRVEVVVSSLADPHLGMADEIYERLRNDIDTIIHSAANVRHYGPPEEFHLANVVATEQLLAFAQEGRPKRFHFISTLSTAYGVTHAPWAVFTEHDVDIGQTPGNVYVASKLEAERRVEAYRAQGGIASIHRVGNITYHSKTGALQKNIVENAFFQRIKACIALKVVPEYLDTVELTFVDQLSRAIVLLCEQATLGNETFHLSNPHLVRLSQLLNASTDTLGIREAASETFLDSLPGLRESTGNEDAVMNMLLHTGLLEQGNTDDQAPVMVLAERTERFLAALGFSWPTPEPQAIRALVRFAIDNTDNPGAT